MFAPNRGNWQRVFGSKKNGSENMLLEWEYMYMYIS